MNVIEQKSLIYKANFGAQPKNEPRVPKFLSRALWVV